MLEDIRKVTLKGISGLSKEQLFLEPIPYEFPIGAYLLHLAEAEIGWLEKLTGKSIPHEIKQKSYYSAWFDVPNEMFNPPSSPLEIEYYINTLNEVRTLLIDYIKSINDNELNELIEIQRSSNTFTKVSKLWIIYHLIEHEAHTRGQIFLLMRMAGFKKRGENN